MGRVLVEDGRLRWTRNQVAMSEFSRTTAESFARPPSEEVVIPIDGHGPQHDGILRNFADAILDGAALIAPAAEGIRSVELANAMICSGWTDQTVRLPLDAADYEARLKRAIERSTAAKKDGRPAAPVDLSRSFGGGR